MRSVNSSSSRPARLPRPDRLGARASRPGIRRARGLADLAAGGAEDEPRPAGAGGRPAAMHRRRRACPSTGPWIWWPGPTRAARSTSSTTRRQAHRPTHRRDAGRRYDRRSRRRPRAHPL